MNPTENPIKKIELQIPKMIAKITISERSLLRQQFLQAILNSVFILVLAHGI